MMEWLLKYLNISSPGSPNPVPQLAMPETNPDISALLKLPSETIDQILRHLPPTALLAASATCHLLRSHTENDLLWAEFVQQNLPVRLRQPFHYKTWRELYIAHHPYWFLPKHKIWYSDKANTGSTLVGQVVLGRYDHRTGCIEAYRLVAEPGPNIFEMWERNNEVIIHVFNPKISLFLDDPVVRMQPGAHPPGGRLQQEILMQREPDRSLHGIRSMVFLTRPIARELQTSSMALWPPSTLPATQRVRNDSSNLFRGEAHRPRTLSEMSDTTFRMRKWMEFRGLGERWGVRMGEDVMTFSTLPLDCYTPTKSKPWQGIWVGDYSGHGCEFLVVIQRDVDESRRIVPFPPEEPSFADPETGLLLDISGEGTAVNPTEEADPPGCTGRLEAIKLTGDPNVPRGEYTWVAEDIGRGGLIRVADEQMFQGARVVKSWGHIAARGFKDGRNYYKIESSWLELTHSR